MVSFLASLSPREATLLLVTLTAGGKEQRDLFAYLANGSRQRLEERCDALLALPGDRRVQLMMRELRTLLSHQGRHGLEYVDPTWILHHLRGESASMVGLLLLSLPTPLARAILRRLPDAVRHALPPKNELKGVPQAIREGLRHVFETRFDPMPEPHLTGTKSLRDLISLERDDLFVVVRDLGLTELGQAFAAIEKMALIDLLRRLPKAEAKELIEAVQSTSQVDMPTARDAQLFLSRIVANFEDTETFLRRSGLWRLARAFVREDEGFTKAMAQRLPRQAGTQFLGYLERARALEEPPPQEALARLSDAILVRVVLLAKAGQITASWAQSHMAYHDEAACHAALDAHRAKAVSAP